MAVSEAPSAAVYAAAAPPPGVGVAAASWSRKSGFSSCALISSSHYLE